MSIWRDWDCCCGHCSCRGSHHTFRCSGQSVSKTICLCLLVFRGMTYETQIYQPTYLAILVHFGSSMGFHARKRYSTVSYLEAILLQSSDLTTLCRAHVSGRQIVLPCLSPSQFWPREFREIIPSVETVLLRNAHAGISRCYG
jgi:hypothetical protein